MKFCPNCGQSLPDDAAFCGNCGTALAGDGGGKEPRAPMSKNAKKGIIAGACAVLVIALAVFLLLRLFSSPAADFVRIQAEFLAARALDPVQAALESGAAAVPREFSSDITISAAVDNRQIDKYLEDASIQLRLDARGDTILADGALNLMGSTVLSGAATYEKGVVGFALPQVDDNYYTLDLAKFIQEQTGEEIDLDSLSMPEISVGEWFSLLKDYGGMVSEAMTKDNLKLERGQEVRFDRLKGSFKGNVYTFEPRAEDIENLLRKLADKVEEDETLRRLIQDSGLSFTGTSLAFSGGIGYGYGAEDLDVDEALRDLADEIRDNAGDIADRFRSAEFTWTLATEGKQVRRIEIKAGGMVLLGYECSGTESKGVEEVFYTEGGYGNVITLEHEYTKQGSDVEGKLELSCGGLRCGRASYERSGKAFDGKLEFGDGHTTYFTASLSGDDQNSRGNFMFTDGYSTTFSGDFSSEGEQVEGAFTVSDGYNTFTYELDVDTGRRSPLGLFYGDYAFIFPNSSVSAEMEVKEGKSGSTDHVLTIRGEEYEFGGMFSRIDITVNTTEKSSVKKPGGKQVDISEYDMEELEELFTDIGEQLEDDLNDIMYELYFTYGL